MCLMLPAVAKVSVDWGAPQITGGSEGPDHGFGEGQQYHRSAARLGGISLIIIPSSYDLVARLKNTSKCEDFIYGVFSYFRPILSHIFILILRRVFVQMQKQSRLRTLLLRAQKNSISFSSSNTWFYSMLRCIRIGQPVRLHTLIHCGHGARQQPYELESNLSAGELSPLDRREGQVA
ncbi:hypothetical protein FB451DRAFT_1187374 [Mycena latifolia]|nr:hypothetical protein FB451DRAFT_1187374 [Mycena latifolia]